jgi:hypothetical protein
LQSVRLLQPCPVLQLQLQQLLMLVSLLPAVPALHLLCRGLQVHCCPARLQQRPCLLLLQQLQRLVSLLPAAPALRLWCRWVQVHC